MKIIISQQEAVDRGIWPEIMQMFGLDQNDDVWQSEEFILTEAQAQKVGLLPR
ncbi:hypothetical protein Q5741_04535 [Paenibacillus sp. JX-17]|uniref:Uncharacterized protein n=1 Tax=Paenibacillus lacisoli TaxID=3064525 RepID=A0ABT9CAV3_9BACL|nr:hypothetical protein [Paenibacillus sp. JX-17]MDO7905678.1 hypothetical protein [Paenibacillus sp. JX-17]